jgi:heme/copper-type cytochrome/quinol oxidase subunit 2
MKVIVDTPEDYKKWLKNRPIGPQVKEANAAHSRWWVM